MRRTALILLSAFALLPAACGADDEETPTTAATPEVTATAEEDSGGGTTSAEGTVEIVMKDFAFEPADATAKVGQEVIWRNEDTAKHDAFSEESGLDTADIGQNGTTSYTPDKAGTIEYICSIHPSMKGTLTVTE